MFGQALEIAKNHIKKIKATGVVIDVGECYRVIVPKHMKCITIPKSEMCQYKNLDLVEVTSNYNWGSIRLGKKLNKKAETREFTGAVVKELADYTYVIQDDNGNRLSASHLEKEVEVGDTLEIQTLLVDGVENPVVIGYKISG